MEIPYYKQEKEYTCGPACARMFLGYFGINAGEDELCRILGTTPAQGTEQNAFKKIANHYNLSFIAKKDASVEELPELQKKGYVVTLCYFYPKEKVSHYSVLKSVDSNSITLLDPYNGPGYTYSTDDFKKLWKIVEKKGREPCWFFALKK